MNTDHQNLHTLYWVNILAYQFRIPKSTSIGEGKSSFPGHNIFSANVFPPYIEPVKVGVLKAFVANIAFGQTIKSDNS